MWILDYKLRMILFFLLWGSSSALTLSKGVSSLALCLHSHSAMWYPDSAHSQRAKPTLTILTPLLTFSELHVRLTDTAIGFICIMQRVSHCRWLWGSRVSDPWYAMTHRPWSHSTLTHWHFVHCHPSPERAKKTKLRLFSHCASNVETGAYCICSYKYVLMHTSMQETHSICNVFD